MSLSFKDDTKMNTSSVETANTGNMSVLSLLASSISYP